MRLSSIIDIMLMLKDLKISRTKILLYIFTIAMRFMKMLNEIELVFDLFCFKNLIIKAKNVKKSNH